MSKSNTIWLSQLYRQWYMLDKEEPDHPRKIQIRPLISQLTEIFWNSIKPNQDLELIADSYFPEYIKRQFINHCSVPELQVIDEFPYTHIDWHKAAQEAKKDYRYVWFENSAWWIQNKTKE